MDQSHLIDLLSRLRSPDNELRKAAEEEYGALVQSSAAQTMYALAELCATCREAGTITIGLILLRKIFNMDPSPFTTASPSAQTAVKEYVLGVLGTAAFDKVQRGSAVACVSALAARIQSTGNTWEELWVNIFTILGNQQSASELQIVCCDIMSTAAAVMAPYFELHGEAIAKGLANCFNSPDRSMEAKSSAFMVVTSLAEFGMLDNFHPLVDSMLTVIQECLNSADWETAERLLYLMSSSVTDSPALFKQHVTRVLGAMMQVAASVEAPASARQAAVEVLVSFCESDSKSVRKVAGFATSFLQLLFQYTVNPVISADWDTTAMMEDEAALEENSDETIGCLAIDRLTIALGGRKLQAAAQNIFIANISSPEWKQRRAALLLIRYSSEGMATVLAKSLDSLVGLIVPAVKDECKYVRESALGCIEQLCSDFAPIIQQQLHQVILPPVVEALADPTPRVAATAADCLDRFFDKVIDADSDDEGDDYNDDEDEVEVGKVYAPYVHRVCEDCVQLLRSTQHMFVREAVLAALSSLTSTCKDLLSPYTDILVPVYQEILAIPDSPETVEMKCTTIECVTLLACGVGKERFMPYAEGVCNYLGSLCASNLKADDMRTRFVARGWTCMVECLGTDSLGYLLHVVPMILTMMNVECDAVITTTEVGEDDDEEEEEGVETIRYSMPGKGERVAKIRTSLLEDKRLGSCVMAGFLDMLEIALEPYFVDIANSALELIPFGLDGSIRRNGVLILHQVMEAYATAKMTDNMKQLAAVSFPKIMEALADEHTTKVMAPLVQLASQCVSASPEVANAETTTMMCQKLRDSLSTISEQRQKILEEKATEHDDDELDLLEEQDEALQHQIETITDIIGVLLADTGAVFAGQLVSDVLPLLASWMQPTADDYSVSCAVGVLCDFVEHASNHITALLPGMCSGVVTFASSRTGSGVLQSCFYFINVITQYFSKSVDAGGADAASFVSQTKPILAAYLADPCSATESYSYTTCNAISALVTFLQFYSTSILQGEAAQILNTVVERLPVGGDLIEAGRVHDRVLGWVANDHVVLQAAPGAKAAIVARVKTANPEALSDAATKQLSAM